MESTTDAFGSFPYLRAKLQEWKANDLLQPTADLSWECFQAVATAHILPVLREVTLVLESEGLDMTLTELEDVTRSLGL